jgi:hypothetical protein
MIVLFFIVWLISTITIATTTTVGQAAVSAVSKRLIAAVAGDKPNTEVQAELGAGEFRSPVSSYSPFEVLSVSGSRTKLNVDENGRLQIKNGDGNMIWRSENFAPTSKTYKIALKCTGRLVVFADGDIANTVWFSSNNTLAAGPYKLWLSAAGRLTVEDSTGGLAVIYGG